MVSTDFESDLAQALASYDDKLSRLEKTSSPSLDDALAVLVQRDTLQDCIPSRPSSEELIQLVQLDDRLRQQKNCISTLVSLDDYRTSLAIKEDAWWWHLEPTPHRWDRFDWVWQALTLIILTPSVSIILDISTRFLGNGPDALGSFAVVAQSAIALATGGSLTDPGRKIIKTILTSLRIPSYLWKETQALLSLCLLLGLFGFRASLPLIARGYEKEARKQQEAGQLALAEENYKRSLNLWPKNLTCYENLGTLYEDLGDLDQAKENYQFAVQGGSAIAYNNLARLYNLDKEYDRAFQLLWDGLTHPTIADGFEKDPRLQPTWYKNLGWARLGQKRYAESEAYLTTAIELAMTLDDNDQTRGSAHCLRAQAISAQNKTQGLEQEWRRCLQYANPSLPENDRWIGMAQEYLISSQSEPSTNLSTPASGGSTP